MNQPDLFHARRTDPETSHVAMRRLSQKAPRQMDKILSVLTKPMTPREIADASGIDYVAVQRLGKSMERQRLIFRSERIVRDGMRVWFKA